MDISPGNAMPSDAKQCMLLPDDSRRSAVAVSGDSFDLLFWGKAGQPRSRSMRWTAPSFLKDALSMGAKNNEHGSERNYCCCQKVECLSPNLASICWDSDPRAHPPNAKNVRRSSPCHQWAQVESLTSGGRSLNSAMAIGSLESGRGSKVSVPPGPVSQ